MTSSHTVSATSQASKNTYFQVSWYGALPCLSTKQAVVSQHHPPNRIPSSYPAPECSGPLSQVCVNDGLRITPRRRILRHVGQRATKGAEHTTTTRLTTLAALTTLTALHSVRGSGSKVVIVMYWSMCMCMCVRSAAGCEWGLVR
jgi:hypothetical protein